MTLAKARIARIARTTGTGAVAVAAAAVLAAPTASAAGGHDGADSRAHRGGSTVFVQTDDTAANTVVAYERAADGTLRQKGTHRTGGKGGVLAGTVVDHLASQGSLAYDRHNQLLYAVNAGSDTVTVFAVHGTHLRRVQEISSGGKFPVSVTFHGNQVYVANALGGGSVQGFVRTGERLVKVSARHRALGLDAATSAVGQVSFTPDGSKLVVTTKASGQSIDVFPVGGRGSHGGPSARPVVTSLPGAVPFGFAFDSAGRIQVTEAGTNSVGTFVVGRDGKLTAKGTVPTGQTATCWAVTAGGNVYVSNAASGTLSGYRVGPQGELTALGNTATDAGTVDAAASSDGRYLYVQTGAKGIVDEFRVDKNGSLTAIGSVVVPGAVGGEGIVAG
ncbi:lactonase family protein [Streptomyces pseudovenezuelae]|uniref:6-phosphogluconolactonase (Cycloisomerase 2 family) n=1 Tax=Streptomyces pseudovenezuelae TaxID=67350 RepID=A0ABT6LPR4_9ACTN|nr:beta-propeller fold lactonase family protein [Streptomyces pseudovenezuelae]MDH6218301.1 6-phosphogluconolactonase (cycloisomerase 2 family) [Streptomyces pseudovenezuelae]